MALCLNRIDFISKLLMKFKNKQTSSKFMVNNIIPIQSDQSVRLL